MRRSTLITLLAALMVMAMALGASAAIAGEQNGNGDETGVRDNANSVCAYSGLNDGNAPDGHVQSWGHWPAPKPLPGDGMHPGQACRGGSNEDRTK
jgi:hypothetical protein